VASRVPDALDHVRTPSGDDAPRAGRIPVYSVWQEKVGPLLSLGMLTAAARCWDDGRLEATFEIRRPEVASSFLADLETRTGPAVLLCSDYVWSIEDNLELARTAKQVCPELVVIHGGPSSPKYADDAARFLAEHGDVADVLVRGEGEQTICELLDVLGAGAGISDQLSDVAGLTFVSPSTGEVVRTPDRERLADLDALPSPYLIGEFDHIDPAAWHYCVSIETNRGCPYGCTFCDWGSSTMSRIRKFDLDRVVAELEWASKRGIVGVQICDANFGIIERDVDIAATIARLRRETSYPSVVSFTPAKNTIKHLTRIFDEILGADIVIGTAISLQTIDPTTLQLVKRSNISTDAYLSLAADLRRRGQPLEGDLLLGLPGQTYESYRTDLQFFMDHEITPRTWSLRMLPNSPMNEPSYREAHGIRTNQLQIVSETATMTADDRERMRRLRKIQVIAHKYGLLRHVMRYLQWDHGILATTVLEAIAEVTADEPARHPLISWVFEYFDLYPTAAVGWHAFLDEFRRLVQERFGVAESSALRCVLEVQEAVLPRPGRALPRELDLEHDYLAYATSGTSSLYESGQAGQPDRRLREYPPARAVVTGDPHRICDEGLSFIGDSRDELIEGNFWIGIGYTYELPLEVR
jgi:radical SAM superfamily enzyme YgiQ (UPF0313 family)